LRGKGVLGGGSTVGIYNRRQQQFLLYDYVAGEYELVVVEAQPAFFSVSDVNRNAKKSTPNSETIRNHDESINIS
jgi:hypothetical protein